MVSSVDTRGALEKIATHLAVDIARGADPVPPERLVEGINLAGDEDGLGDSCIFIATDPPTVKEEPIKRKRIAEDVKARVEALGGVKPKGRCGWGEHCRFSRVTNASSARSLSMHKRRSDFVNRCFAMDDHLKSSLLEMCFLRVTKGGGQR